MTTHDEVVRAVAAAHRDEWRRVMAATLRTTRDLDLAEESVQDAYEAALLQWKSEGVPTNPGAWLTTTAKRRALDAIRRAATLGSKLPLLVYPDAGDPARPEPVEGPSTATDPPRIQDEAQAVVLDEQLRLIFLCCHPALSPEARVALTLRLVCGVTTPDIAAAFLVPVPTMAARLTRAKRKIAVSRIACRVPDRDELPARLDDALDVVSVLLATGHAPPTGEEGIAIDLVDQAVSLAETLHSLLPNEPETAGALAQTLLIKARAATRTDAHGRPVPLPEQDRSQWDHDQIDRAHDLIIGGFTTGGRGRYLLRAAIASLIAQPERWDEIDWLEVVQLYDALLLVDPSPIVALNRAVAVSEVDGPQVALALVTKIENEESLARYRYLYATKAYLLRELGRTNEADAAATVALSLAENTAERDVLSERFTSS